jgi:pimeloyl-ACP methyl ester carboxylesterase
MSAIRRAYVDTPEGQLHYRERPGEGRPLLLLHQTASSSVMWERVIRAFPAGRRLIALDTPGFGGSDGPPELPADGLAYYARRVVGFLDALGLEQVDVAAHHTGAMVAIELGIVARERVGRMILIGTVLVTAAEGREWMDHIARWEPDARGDFVGEVLLPRLHGSVTTDDPEHMLQELTAYLQAGPSWWWAYEAVFTWDGRARLPLLDGRGVLFAVGGDEPQMMLDWTTGTAELVPGAELQVLDGLGVEMAFQSPERTAQAIAAHVGA